MRPTVATSAPGRRGTTTDAVVPRVFPNVSNGLAYHWQLFLPIGSRRSCARTSGTSTSRICTRAGICLVEFAARHLRAAGVPFVTSRTARRRASSGGCWPSAPSTRIVGQRVLRDAARVIAVSEAERQQLFGSGVAGGRRSRSCRIRSTSTSSACRFSAAASASAARIKAGPIVLFLGNLTPRKRVDLLVDAFARLDRSDATLVIAGNDMGAAAPASRRRFVREVSKIAVRFTGLLRGHERLEALADADVVVYPSEHEVFGLVPLEALLAGTAVVVDRTTRDAAKSSARRVADRSFRGHAGAIGEAIKLVIQANPSGGEPRPRARPFRVRELYGNEPVCNRLLDLYRAILGAG